MNQEEIIDIFKDHGRQCGIYEDDPSPGNLIKGLYECRILDIIVTLKSGQEITIFCGDTTIIDATNSSPGRYVGFGNTLVEPMSDIEDIKVSWR